MYMFNVYKKPTKSANRKYESDRSKNASHDMGYLFETCDQISDFCYQVAEKNILEGRTDRQTEVKQYTSLRGAGV